MTFLGPVFRYDMVRVARRQPLALWCAAYGLGLLLALFVLYAAALPEAMFGGAVSKNDAAAFGRHFFNVFTAIQFAAVILITPALTANAIAEEKSSNTLLFLLTTHLTNREIVLGKLMTRLLLVGLLVLTGLPVLAIMQLVGGIEPSLVFATYVMLAVTAVSVGSLGLACGVFVRKPQMAAWRAYQILIAYFALSFLGIWYWDLPNGPRATALAKAQRQLAIAWAAGRPTLVVSGPTPDLEATTFEHFLEWFNIPNPYFAHLRLADFETSGSAPVVGLSFSPTMAPTKAVSIIDAIGTIVRDYSIVHGGMALLLIGATILRLAKSRPSNREVSLTRKS